MMDYHYQWMKRYYQDCIHATEFLDQQIAKAGDSPCARAAASFDLVQIEHYVNVSRWYGQDLETVLTTAIKHRKNRMVCDRLEHSSFFSRLTFYTLFDAKELIKDLFPVRPLP
jgi:hypothetical protein